MEKTCPGCGKYRTMTYLEVCSRCKIRYEREVEYKQSELDKGCDCPMPLERIDDTGRYCANCGKNIR